MSLCKSYLLRHAYKYLQKLSVLLPRALKFSYKHCIHARTFRRCFQTLIEIYGFTVSEHAGLCSLLKNSVPGESRRNFSRFSQQTAINTPLRHTPRNQTISSFNQLFDSLLFYAGNESEENGFVFHSVGAPHDLQLEFLFVWREQAKQSAFDRRGQANDHIQRIFII